MVPFWADVAKNCSGDTKALTELAQVFDSINKIIVLSQTLVRAEERNIRIARTNF